jgi:hypothetical protein
VSARRKRSACLGLLLCLAAVGAWPLDVTQGRIRLTLHEGVGRFSIGYLTDLKGSAYRSFLVPKDPRTSSLSLVVSNTVYRLGEIQEFRETAEKTSDGARFTWTSPFLQVREEFSFLASTGSPLADGVRIDLVLKNVSERDLSVGVRYLLDTYLGESSYVHFRTDRIAEVGKEMALNREDRPQYWVSPLVGDPDGFGLMCMLSGQGITTPDRIVFANWKRLSDTTWLYEINASRGFSLLPYSVNDSAVSHYFNPRSIPPGAEIRIVSVLGRYTKAGFTLEAAAGGSAGSSVKEALDATRDIKDPVLAARADIAAIDGLISQIDRKLAEGQPVTDDELAVMDAVIAELKQRAGRYSTGAGK